jgi:hypothetical protein
MQSRKVRVPAAGVLVRLGSASGDLVNVSVTGALLRLDRELPIGSKAALQMGPIEVDCEVVRCLTGNAPRGSEFREWLVAVLFSDLTRDTVQMVRELVSEMSQRTAAVRV